MTLLSLGNQLYTFKTERKIETEDHISIALRILSANGTYQLALQLGEVSVVTIFLLEDPGNLSTIVTRPWLRFVDVIRIFLSGIGLRVAITTIRLSIAIGMVPPRLHRAVLPAEVGLRAVAGTLHSGHGVIYFMTMI